MEQNKIVTYYVIKDLATWTKISLSWIMTKLKTGSKAEEKSKMR